MKFLVLTRALLASLSLVLIAPVFAQSNAMTEQERANLEIGSGLVA